MENGGSAFPRPGVGFIDLNGNDVWELPQDGMSLRDWFAGMALEGLLASRMDLKDFEHVACAAYMLADAMIKRKEIGRSK